MQSGLKDFVAAGKAIKEALSIMEQLGLQRHERDAVVAGSGVL